MSSSLLFPSYCLLVYVFLFLCLISPTLATNSTSSVNPIDSASATSEDQSNSISISPQVYPFIDINTNSGDNNNNSTMSATQPVVTQVETAEKSRQIDQRVLSREQAEGQGARVRRSIGSERLRSFDPFLLLDEFRSTPGAGFPDHPHRGFETVSYILQGSFVHEDFAGNTGKIETGDLQWMTAGRGIVHSEIPGKDAHTHGLQLWVNLAKKDKMVEPQYQELKAAQIPKVTKDGVTATVIAGTALGTTSPVYTRTPTYYIHYLMEPHSSVWQPIPKGWNSFMYTLEGQVYVGEKTDKNKCDPHYTITLTNKPDLDGVRISSGAEKASFVFLAGQPLNEPVVQHGPFVMNSREEIQQTFLDYQNGRNGFERAPGWRSKIGGAFMDGEDY